MIATLEWLVLGYEGSMWRDNKPYEQKRSKTLKKRKDFIDEEFPISKIIEGNGNWSGCAKAVEFIMPGDKRDENGDRPKGGIKARRNSPSSFWRTRTSTGRQGHRHDALLHADARRYPALRCDDGDL
jgi:hypothetical protein